MGACRFTMMDKNPNDTVGGGGCACSETKNPDQKGPFAVFAGTEMDSGASPHLVVCVGCAEGITEAGEGELLTTPQGDVIDSSATELPSDEELPEL
jgi:hypothetical protein